MLSKLSLFALLTILVAAVVHGEGENAEQLRNNNDYLLPKSIVPTAYDIKYTELDFKTFTFKGIIRINALVKQKTREVVLHKGNLTAFVTAVTSRGNVRLAVVDSPYNKTTEKWTIMLKEELKPSDEIGIQLIFNGTLREDMIGFYRSSYIDERGEERWLASTQFETTHARHAFPCFDEPALKAKFNVSILLPDGLSCLGNMPSKIINNWCIFDESVPMSTYLVAFIVSDFASLTNSTFGVWSRANALTQAKYPLKIGTQAIANFARELDSPYQLPKMDMVAVPDFSAGAMENWGLITYRETAVLYDENESSDVAQQRVASVIVHELAHMWFGNLVTPEWWSYLWLSEAFARYYQYMATDQIIPSWRMDQQFVVEQHQAALGVDALEESEPMTRYAVTQAEIGKMGDSITYSKGASIVRMMERTFGHDVFVRAIRNYLKARKYQSATPDDLWQSIQTQIDAERDPLLNVSVAKVMRSWTEQPGFPYITVTIKPDRITLGQERFLLRNLKNTVPTESTWSVPISWTSSSRGQSTKPVYWLSERNAQVPNAYKDDDWLILNVESAGFYRVQYDKDSWNRIISLLTSGDFEKIHELNRAAIVDDLLNLARAELLNYETALRGVRYLSRETNYLPFKSAFTGLDYLIRKFSSRTDNYIFKEYVVSLFKNIYGKLTYNDKSGDDRLTILHRQEINNQACRLDHSECIVKSRKLFLDWTTKGKAIPKNQRPAAYCAAIKYGTADDWNFLYNQYRNSNVAAEQVVILNALGCSRDTKILERYLLLALSSFKESRIRKQDVSSVFTGVYSASVQNAEFMLDFVEKHYDAIFKYHNGYGQIGSLISGAVQKFPSEKSASRLESIMKKNATHIQSVTSSLEKAQKLLKFELAWADKHLPTIINWIKANKDSDVSPSNENTTAYRLPGNVIPSSYALHLTPFIGPNNFTFDGKVKIFANVISKTDKIVLHTDQITIHQVTVHRLRNNAAPEKLEHVNMTRTEKYHFTNIIMKYAIEANTDIRIEVAYTGKYQPEMRGFYRSSYKIKNETRWLVATHLEPVGARRVFPCFDEPALKATFNISVDVPGNYHAVSNMRVKLKTGNLWEFETTPRMSTYLMALVVSDFESKFQTQSNRSYGVWSSPVVSHQLNYSLEVMGPIVDFFEQKLGHSYGLPKLEMIALPDFASGAMENWGLITYRETGMLYDEVTMSSLSAKQSVRNVIAHEITHQWFGNIVSPLWWDYLWLSEGFARYFQCHAYTEAEATWNLETQFVVDHQQTSFANDASTGTHPVTAKVYSPTEIRSIFDKISYAKAGSLIRMLEKLVGPKVFYGALNRYLEDRKFSTGTPEALFTAFQLELDSSESVRFNVTSVMNTWTRQSGFPVVDVTFSGDIATLTQKRFFLRPHNDTSKPSWLVPINWATRSHPNFNATQKVSWLNKKLKVKVEKASTEWVIFNLQQAGYYRVNYDDEMWRRIITALKSNERHLIHEINRAALIDDLLNLGRAGLLNYDLVLSGMSYMSLETEYAPWKAAYEGMTYLSRRFAGRAIFEAHRAYLLTLLEPSYQRLGFEDAKNDRHMDMLLRRLVLEWLCSLEQEECVAEARRLFKRERNDANYRVPPNQRSIVYCTAIRHGTTDDWDYLWKKHEETDYATEKLTIMGALACSKNPTDLNRLLIKAITPESGIRSQDSKKVFSSLIDSGLIGVQTLLEFIETHYETIIKSFGDDSVVRSNLSSMSKRLSTTELMEKFEALVKSAPKTMPNLAKNLQSYLKRANIEANWYNTRGPKIHEWLARNNPREDYRLPTFAKPEAYDIYIKPYFEERQFVFEGKVFIDVRIEADTSMIVLHAHELNITRIYVADNSAEITSRAYNEKTQQLSIFFASFLAKGTRLRLGFDYTAQLRDDMRGFYRSYYIDDDGKTRWIASTQFEPVYARRAFPCFDEPLFKASFTVHIAKPKGYHTLSNMGSSPKERTDSNNVVWDDYEPSVKMSPYLLAFVVSDFVKISESSSRVAVWSKPQLKQYMNYAPVVGRKALEFLEDFTGIAFPLKEMNFVAVPDFDMGAMENWGLVTYREYGLTYDVYKISATYKKYANTVISHELVHMWFGNLVTCEWWDYTWLNEGFAEYLAYIVSNASEPSWELMKQFVVAEMHLALEVDSSGSSHPMNNKVLTPTEAQDGFDKIAYQKSASVLRMLHHSFGQKVFVEALHKYLDGRKYNTARPEYLVAAIQERLEREPGKAPGDLKVDVATVMNSWITQAGYPVVTAKRHGTSVVLSQERFIQPPSNSSDRDRVYWTPITYTTATKRNFRDTTPRLWLGKENKTITIAPNDAWYILNVQEIGFYRVNYDQANWQRLIDLLNSNSYTSIDELNRAQIIDDLMNLARTDYVDYELALDASKYLLRETSYLPWKAYFGASAYLAQRIEGQPLIKKLYTRHIETLTTMVYEKLGFKEDPINDRHLDQLNRELILNQACKYDLEDCVQKAKTYFKQESISPNIATAVYCTAIRHGTSRDWDTLWDKYTKAVLATEYLTILRGLGCSKNVTVLERYMDLALASNSKIRRQDIGTVFSAIYSSGDIGLRTAFNYFENNLDKLYAYYGNWHDVGSVFKGLASYISSEEQIQRIEKLAEDNNETVLNIKSSLKSAVQTAKKNLDWFDRHSPSILSWLIQNYNMNGNTQGRNSSGSLMPNILTCIIVTLASISLYFKY